jgi:hypothetical protein
MTDFDRACAILSELYIGYSDDPEFRDFIEYNDIGIPLAHFINDGLVKELDPSANIYIEETFSLLCKSLGYKSATYDFDCLDELFEMAPSREE